jgi:predicted transcriptional regulator
MYKSYLSYAQLNEYLSLLLERDLLSYEPETQLYKITPKSLRFLSAYEQIRELVLEPKAEKLEDLQ